MKYFIRSLKSLLYFIIIFVAIVAILFIFSKQKASGMQISDMFQPGSLPKLILFFVFFGAVYPATGFLKRKLDISKDYAEYRGLIESSMSDLGYVLEKEDGDTVTFRKKDLWQRVRRMFGEDRITMEISDGAIVVEGYRKDVMRVMSILTYKVREVNSQEE